MSGADWRLQSDVILDLTWAMTHVCRPGAPGGRGARRFQCRVPGLIPPVPGQDIPFKRF